MGSLGGVRGTGLGKGRWREGGGSDDDFAQSTNLLSPPGHAASAPNGQMGGWVGAANESHPPSLAEYGPGREAGASGERQKLETLILILATFSCLPALPPVFRVRAEGGMEICK